METGPFSFLKQCKQVSCGVPPRVVSADIQVCVDCEVHCNGSLPYTCITGHTLDASPNGSNAFTAKSESSGLFSGVENCTAFVCGAPLQSWKNGTIVKPCVVPTCGKKVSYKCLSGFSVNGTPSENRLVSQHIYVETTVHVPMDTLITLATAKLDSMQFPSVRVRSVMRSTSALSGMVMDLALRAHATTKSTASAVLVPPDTKLEQVSTERPAKCKYAEKHPQSNIRRVTTLPRLSSGKPSSTIATRATQLMERLVA